MDLSMPNYQSREECGDTTTNRGSQPGNLLDSGSKTRPRKKAGHLFSDARPVAFTFDLIPWRYC